MHSFHTLKLGDFFCSKNSKIQYKNPENDTNILIEVLIFFPTLFFFTGKFLLESEDSSKHHSRNSSTGSNNIPTTTIVVNVEPDLAVQNEASQQSAEAERLLSDQRSSE